MKVSMKKIENLIVCRFSELNLNGLKLSKLVVDSLCQLAQSSCLSGLMISGSSIGTVSEFLFFYCFSFIIGLQVCFSLVATEC